MQLTSSAIQVAQQLLAGRLKTARIVVDATAGNGGDTLFLAEHSPAAAKVYAFDVQAEAIDATRARTTAYEDKIEYIIDTHEAVDLYVKEAIDAALFNLGYLPGGDHALTTQVSSTVAAVQKVCNLLSANGVLVIVAYPGHEAGREEQGALEEMLQKLPCRNFTVGCYQMINHKAGGPLSYIIEKVRR